MSVFIIVGINNCKMEAKINMKKYGYIRVSTKEQNPERQIYAMEAENIKKQNIYVDKISGKGFDRPQYCRMVKKIESRGYCRN